MGKRKLCDSSLRDDSGNDDVSGQALTCTKIKLGDLLNPVTPPLCKGHRDVELGFSKKDVDCVGTYLL